MEKVNFIFFIYFEKNNKNENEKKFLFIFQNNYPLQKQILTHNNKNMIHNYFLLLFFVFVFVFHKAIINKNQNNYMHDILY